MFITLFYIFLLVLAIFIYVFTNETFSIPLAYMLFCFIIFSLFVFVGKILYKHVDEESEKNKKMKKSIILVVFSFISLIFFIGVVACFCEIIQGAKHITLYEVSVVSEEYKDADGEIHYDYYLVGYTSNDEKMTIEINKNVEKVEKYIKITEKEKFEVYYYDLPNYLYKIE